MASIEQFPHDDELLGLRMVKDRVITEAHLSTALDFQRAVGSTLSEVLLRLGLVGESDLSAYLDTIGHSAAGGEDPAAVEAAGRPTNAGQDKTVPLPEPPAAPLPREEPVSLEPQPWESAAQVLSGDGSPLEAADLVEERLPGCFEHVSESAIVLNALVALLVRKGVIGPEEIKEEVLRMDTGELLRGSAAHLE